MEQPPARASSAADQPSAWLPAERSAWRPQADLAVPSPPAPVSQQASTDWLPAGATTTLERAPAPPAPESADWQPPGSSEAAQLSAQQRVAVHAYCQEMCGADRAAIAAEDATSAISGSGSVDERELLQATRLAAATHAAVPIGGSGWKSRFVDALAAEHEVNCRRVPTMLAQRANGQLSKGERAALDDHLHRCLRCRATEVRGDRAERAFVAAGAGTALGAVEAAAAQSPATPRPVDTPAPLAAPAEPAAAGEHEPAPQKWEAASTAVIPATVLAAASAHDASAAAPRRRGGTHRRALVAAACLLLLAGIAVAGIAIANHGKSSSAATSSPTVASTPKVSTPAHRVQHRIVHRAHASKPHRRAHPRRIVKPTTTVVAAAPTSAPTPTPSAPVVNSALSAPAPSQPVAQPAPSQPASSSSPSTISISQPSLGSAPARTQGIGGGKHH